jgi:hypothetical protein
VAATILEFHLSGTRTVVSGYCLKPIQYDMSRR